MPHTIAIDGPAASGKSTASKRVAAKLGFDRLDSGMLYRAITLVLDENGLADRPDSEEGKKRVSEISLIWKNQRIVYNSKDITDQLHTPRVDSKVGLIAKHLFIRDKVHQMQHEIISKSSVGVIVDGRDIGTVVLPDAFLKIFITAKQETRAERRVKQFGGEYEKILEEIKARDWQDENREHGPLKQAKDAIRIENDEMTLDETVNKVVQIYKERVRQSN